MSNDTLSMKFHQNIIMNSKDTGERIDIIISKQFEQFSRTQIQKWLKKGSILVNNRIVKPKYIIVGDEKVEINIKILPTNKWIAEDLKLNIIYEDNDIIVIDKSINMVVHPGAGNITGTISNALLYRYKDQYKLPRAGIVHRLDKDTSGLMVVAKNSISYLNLIQQLSERKVSRKYLAIVKGEIYKKGTINKPIGRDYINRTKMAINYKGKEAITHYIPIKVYDGFTIIECQLETGRTHQIRVHMKSIKHPLVGDKTYNISCKKKQKIFSKTMLRQALHAYKLSFIHPLTLKTIEFRSKLPKDILVFKSNLDENIDILKDFEKDYSIF